MNEMSLSTFNKKAGLSLVSGAIMFLAAFSVDAGSAVAFPGKYKAKLVSIDAANVISLYVDVWAGYPRSFKVSLPGVAIPVVTLKTPVCQVALLKKAEALTNEFINDAEFIEVKDIRMENTAGQDATSEIYTNKGSLSAKLKAEGVARPVSIEPTKPWC